MKKLIPCLSIAGSDPSCGAGIQADLKTFSALGVYGLTVMTAVTVQNTRGVQASYPIPAHWIKEQLHALFEDFHIPSVKIGMVANRSIIQVIAETLEQYHPSFIVLDPIIASTSGHSLLHGEDIAVLQSTLFPLCTLITPNLPEAQILSGITIQDNLASTIQAGRAIILSGCPNVLIKGGHRQGQATDILVTPHSYKLFTSDRITSHNTHGTGCTLSSAIAAYIAQGMSLETAIEKSKQYIYQAIKHAQKLHLGHGKGPLHHFFMFEK